MTFTATYRVDDATSLPLPQKTAQHVVSAGAYEGGLFAVLDQSLSESIIESWRWLLGNDAIALIATSLGDFFFWSEKHGSVFFLEVQRGKSTFIDRDLDFFLNQFLVQPQIQDQVLQRDLFHSLVERLGKPRYGQCYVAEPWLRLGGIGDVSTYTKGDLLVYVNLVGQSVQQSMK